MKAYRTDKAYTPFVSVDGVQAKITLPDGCIGVCYVFKTKKQAKDFLGKDVVLTDVSYEIKDVENK